MQNKDIAAQVGVFRTAWTTLTDGRWTWADVPAALTLVASASAIGNALWSLLV